MKHLPLLAAFALGVVVASVFVSVQLQGFFAEPDREQVAGSAPAITSLAATETRRCLDEAEMRRIIREELATATAAIVPAQGTPAPGQADNAPAPVASPAQVALVNRQLDGYIQAGVISDSEMARLQSEIGKLDPAARRAAMQRLVRALNSGALDGRL
jgi:hypothetical protein